MKLNTKERAIIARALYSWAGTFDDPRTVKAQSARAARIAAGTDTEHDRRQARFQLGQKYQCPTDYDNAAEWQAVARLFRGR